MTRLAIIGAGNMGTIHARSCLNVPNAIVTWVADKEMTRAQAVAGTLGARATTDADAALRADDVDAVIVTVPTYVHHIVAERAAAAGKHIFCEKPIARTLAEARAIVGACQRAGVRLMVGHVVRFFPDYARIAEELQRGVIGPVGVVRASRLNRYPSVPQEGGARTWYADFALSGGPILDLMIHDLDTLRWYFGDVERVFARSLSGTPYQQRTDYALAVLRFANGVIAHVEASWAHAGFRTMIELTGTHGVLRHTSEETAAIRVEQTAPVETRPGAIVPRGPLPAGPYETELRHFLDGLAGGTPFLTDGEEGLHALEVALAAIESARTGRAIHFVSGHPVMAEASP